MKKNFISYISCFFAFALLVAIDQLTKVMAFTKLNGRPAYNLIKDVLQFVYVQNDGAAWGMFSGKQTFFIILTTVMIALIIFIFIKTPGDAKYRPFRVVLVTLAAGALGNLIDRVMNGYVHDFIYFKIIDFPVFNFADMCVTVSMAVLILLIIFKYKDKDFDFLTKIFHPHKENDIENKESDKSDDK